MYVTYVVSRMTVQGRDHECSVHKQSYQATRHVIFYRTTKQLDDDLNISIVEKAILFDGIYYVCFALGDLLLV